MFRCLFRTAWVAWELGSASIRWCLLAARPPKSTETHWRAVWTQQVARRLLTVMDVEWRARGARPQRGLLVCNHLSYLDILVIAAVTPAVFVAKSDVRRWPVFGWLTRMAGTVFVNRGNRLDVRRVNGQVQQALNRDALVVIFPEGTSSGGDSVLPFHSSLLAPVVDTPHPVTVAYLRYELADGSVEREVCYWGDMVFGPHLLNLLGKRGIRAELVMHRWRSRAGPDRKGLARELREQMLQISSPSPNSRPLRQAAPRPVSLVWLAGN